MKKNSCATHIGHFLSEMFLSPLPLLHKEHVVCVPPCGIPTRKVCAPAY